MNIDELRARQAPLKEAYRQDPSSAQKVLHAVGVLDPEGIVCRVETHLGAADAGLHPASGGD
jgi:ribosomal protein S5